MLAPLITAFAAAGPPLTEQQKQAAIRAKAALKDGTMSDTVLRDLRGAQEKSPDHPALASLLGAALLGGGRLDEAAPLMKRALVLAPTAPGMSAMQSTVVDALLAQKRMPEAQAIHRIAQHPLSHFAHQTLALLLAQTVGAGASGAEEQQEQQERAREHAARAVELAPQTATSYLALGLALSAGNATALGKRERKSAVAAFRTALGGEGAKAAPLLEAPLRAEARHGLGLLLSSTSRRVTSG